MTTRGLAEEKGPCRELFEIFLNIFRLELSPGVANEPKTKELTSQGSSEIAESTRMAEIRLAGNLFFWRLSVLRVSCCVSLAVTEGGANQEGHDPSLPNPSGFLAG